MSGIPIGQAQMDRRTFISRIAMAFAAAPLAARAQPAGARLRRVGYLSGGSDSPREAAFRQGLRELGHIEGRNVVVEYRFADGDFKRLPRLALELVRLGVEVIVTSSTPANRAAQQATKTIPIVMALTGDIAVTGGIASLARPGGNVTGLSNISAELGGKRLQLLRESLSKLSRIAVFRNPANPVSATQLAETEAGARAIGIQIQLMEVTGPDDFESAFGTAISGRADALVWLPDAMFVVHRKRLAELASRHRLPTMGFTRELPEAGALMSYGPDTIDMHRRAAGYVDRILKGALPADLPVEEPAKFEFVINLKTAKSLGLAIPQAFLVRADELIR